MKADDGERAQRYSTLQMIATELGLDVSTVSRVLNSTPEGARRAASKATADKIRSLASDVGYSPNPHARSLRSRRSGEVGVLVPRVSDLVLANIYEAIQTASDALDVQSFVLSTYDDPARHNRALATLAKRRVDGVILGDARLDEHDYDRPSLPAVAVSRRAPSLTSITGDDEQGGRLAAEHLLSLGHAEVAVLAGQPYASTGVDRTKGFVERYREAGLEVPASRIVACGFDTHGGRTGVDRLGDALDGITAIFAVNDFTAIGAIGALRQRGISVGEDFALVGYNDVSLAADLPVPLSTVRSPMADMGARAFDALMAVIGGEEFASEQLAPTLQARESTLEVARARPGAARSMTTSLL